jgi:hypothetical protein
MEGIIPAPHQSDPEWSTIADEVVERRETVHVFHFCFLLFSLTHRPHKEESMNCLIHKELREWVK